MKVESAFTFGYLLLLAVLSCLFYRADVQRHQEIMEALQRQPPQPVIEFDGSQYVQLRIMDKATGSAFLMEGEVTILDIGNKKHPSSTDDGTCSERHRKTPVRTGFESH